MFFAMIWSQYIYITIHYTHIKDPRDTECSNLTDAR